MATDKKISAMASVVPTSDDYLPVVDKADYVTKKCTVADTVASAIPADVVRTSRTVNWQALSSDVVLTASDVGADAAGSAAAVAGDLATHDGLTGTAVHGLGSASTASTTDFDASGAAAAVAWDLATHEGLTGTAVHGLGSASVADSSDFDAAGAASAVAGDLATHEGLSTAAHGGIVADTDPRLTDARTPTAHATSHKSGGTDAIKLDELAAPTDVTTLDASETAHGLLPKLSGNATDALRGDGTWWEVTAGGDMYKADNLSGLADNATARTNIGLGATDIASFWGVHVNGTQQDFKTGSISTSGSDSSVVGDGTAFLSELTGYASLNIDGAFYVIDAISSNTALTVYWTPAAVSGYPVIAVKPKTVDVWGVAGDGNIIASGTVEGSNLSGVNTGDQFTATSASKLIGRGSASGAGAAQEIDLGTGLSMIGTTLNVAWLVPVATKTANYTANAGEIVPCSVAGGSFAVTLPSAPADGTRVRVQLLTVGTNAYLEVKAGGSDKFFVASFGPTSLNMYLYGETQDFQYQATGAFWNAVSTAPASNFATGFPGIDAITPITDADISLDVATRVLTITPPLGFFNFYVDGNGKMAKFRKTGATPFPAFTDTSGEWYFYFDATGTAVSTQTPWTADEFSSVAPVYRIRWNATLYSFTVTAANATLGATYTNNGKTFTVTQTVAGGATLHVSGTWAPEASGTLTRASGTGDATITFSAVSDSDKPVAQYVEYHQNTIAAEDHKWKHLYGSIWESGFTMASNVLATGTPNADGRNTVVALSSGHVMDDNLDYVVTNSNAGTRWTQDLGNTTPASLNATNSALFKVFTQDAAGLMSFLPATRFPFAWNATSNRPERISSTGVRTVITDNRWFVYFVYSTQNPVPGEALKIVSAVTEFTSLSNAQAVNWVDIQNAYPAFAMDFEIRPLYRIIFYNDNSGGGAFNAGCKYSVIREIQDIRKTLVSTAAAISGSLPASSVTTVAYDDIPATNMEEAKQQLADQRAKLVSPTFTTPAIAGSSTGKTTIGSANASATDYVATLPAATGTLAYTSDITKAAVGLSNVTDDVQTKASIVPNTAPAAGEILIGNAGGTAYAKAAMSGDVSLSSSGAATIANGAVTYAKMQDVSATSRVIGRKTAGAGDLEELTLSETLDFIGSAAQWDLLYRGASAWTRLGAGTSGQYLKTNGTWANPEWGTVSAGAGGIWTQDTATRTANTTFTVVGNQSAIYVRGLIVKWTASSAQKCARVVSSAYSSVTTVTIVGDVMASIDASSFYRCSVAAYEKRFAIAGSIDNTVQTDVADAYYAMEPMRVLCADIEVGSAGTTGTTTVDINKAGTTMFTTKPTLASTVAYSTVPFTADTATSLAIGDKVTIDKDGGQTGTPAIDLYVQLYLFPTRYFALA